ncbi:MAG: TrbG/VirB9 family P-type conjugative transfer protein, partial [Pseudomonadota bacterium]
SPAFAQTAQQEAADGEAAATQAPAPADNRIVTVVYDDASVFTIRGKVKVQTTVKFADDERIENVAIGDSKAWQVQPNKAQGPVSPPPRRRPLPAARFERKRG